VNDPLTHEIVARFHAGTSMRRIAQSLQISRGRVRRVLDQVEHARAVGTTQGLPQPMLRRGSQLDAYETAVTDLLARYPDITAQRVFEELRRMGYQGGYTILSERVRAMRPRPAVAPVIRFETGPGVQAQMDYSTYDLDFTDEGRRRVYAFSYILGYSRRQYVHFVESQDFATTIREHIRAFAHLGGVAATCLYDNMKVVVTGYDDDEPIYNPRFLGFAAHYGFRPVACRPRRAQTKGKVERPFGYVESNLLGGRTFRSLEHLNETTAWWLAQVADVRIHRETKARPADRHAEEQIRLLPLPARPFDVSHVVYRIVDAEGYVVYRQNFYSSPWRLIGRNVPVRVTENELTIYDPSLALVAVHPLFPRGATGGRSHLEEHQPPRDSQRRSEQLAQRFAEFGSAGTRFLEGLLASTRYGKNQAERALSLMAAYSRQDVLAALERAVQYGAFSLGAIQRILAARSQPQTPREALADDYRTYLENLSGGEPTPPRPTAEYQALLGQEAHDAEATDLREPAGSRPAHTERAEPGDAEDAQPRGQGSDTAPPS
jgi:transposase